MAGWSFDYSPFYTLDAGEYDILFVYDYNEINIPSEIEKIKNYKNKILIAWSMGVFASYKLKDIFKSFDKKIAINGTITPVDNNYGIPIKAFELTLKYAQKTLEGKFYKNLFYTDKEYDLYKKYPICRTIENRVSELVNLYENIIKSDFEYEKFFDYAIVSKYDKIIPPNNQIASHNKNRTNIIILPYGHFPYYNFSSWKEITQCK